MKNTYEVVVEATRAPPSGLPPQPPLDLRSPVPPLCRSKVRFILVSYFIHTTDHTIFRTTLISLINVELGINVEGVQKLPNHYTWSLE